MSGYVGVSGVGGAEGEGGVSRGVGMGEGEGKTCKQLERVLFEDGQVVDEDL